MASRFTRQIRLAEVGSEGQARLETATLALACSGDAREIEETYLRAAGANVMDGGPSVVLPFAVKDAAARDVALGAYAALVALRSVWLRTRGGSRG